MSGIGETGEPVDRNAYTPNWRDRGKAVTGPYWPNSGTGAWIPSKLLWEARKLTEPRKERIR